MIPCGVRMFILRGRSGSVELSERNIPIPILPSRRIHFTKEPGGVLGGILSGRFIEYLYIIRDFTIAQPGFSNHTTVGGDENVEAVVFGTGMLGDEIDNDSEPITEDVIE